MLNRIETNVVPFNSNEMKINQLKAIDHEMKVLKAKFDKTKEELINGYFATNEEFVGSEGLVLATYKSQTRNSFDSSTFKKEHEMLYADYLKESTVNVFLLKK